MNGKVIEVFSALKGQSGFPRPIVTKLELIEKYGIKNDKFADKDEEKSVMIVGINTYNIAKEEGIDLEFGSLGENILLDFNPHDFNIGTNLQIGDTIIEISQKCTICNHLAIFSDDLPILIQDCRGLYCKIIKGGTILKDSPIKVLGKIHLNKKFAS
ncbi:MAG: MOSC domain-containing protein [Halarcobacter sp.]